MKALNRTIIRTIFFMYLLCSIDIAEGQGTNAANIACPGGVNVNSYNGNINLSRTDINIPARKFNLDITFKYNSFDFQNDYGFGKGWSLNYLMSYYSDSTGVTIVRSGGRSTKFEGDTSLNEFLSPLGVYDSISFYEPGKLVLITKGQTKFYFDDIIHSKLTKIEESNGNFLSFAYTDSMLTHISDPAGRTLQLNYSSGRLIQVVDAIDSPVRYVNYSYDTHGNLKEVTDPMGYVVKYTYIINGPLKSVSDKNGNVVDIVYDSNLLVSEVISCMTHHRFTFNRIARTSHVVEAVEGGNQLTVYEYDVKGNLIRQKGNCCGFNVEYKYDNSNRLIEKVDANGNRHYYAYDSKGNIASVTDPLGSSVYFTYESSFNNVSTYKDKNGSLTSYSYDNKGNLTQVEYPQGIVNQFSYSANGDLIAVINGKGTPTTYGYDLYGNMINIVKQLGQNYSRTYNARSRNIAVVDPSGNSNLFSYDNLDRVISFSNTLGVPETYEYDSNSNLISVTDREGHESIIAYDALDRLVSISDPLGGVVEYSYDSRGNLTSKKNQIGGISKYLYNSYNRLISYINELNEVTEYQYDLNGNRVAITYPNGNVIFKDFDALNRVIGYRDNLGTISNFQYDAMNRVMSITDARGISTSYAYDGLGRLIMKMDGKGLSYEYAYDSNSNLISIKNRNNNIQSITYDLLDRPLTFTNEVGNSESYSYDQIGNMLSITDFKGNTTDFEYDAVGRNTLQRFADGTEIKKSYNNNGRLIGKIFNSGSEIKYSYNPIGKLISREIPGTGIDNYSYDLAGNLISATNSVTTLLFAYNNANRLISETNNGRTTSISHDVSSQTISVLYPSGREIVNTYNDRGKLSEVNEDGLIICSFVYDEVNQLITKHLNDAKVSLNYTLDENRKVIQVNSTPLSVVSENYNYDNEGNIIMLKRSDQQDYSTQYSYDAEQQVVEFKRGVNNGSAISSPSVEKNYVYDANKNKISVTTNSNTVLYNTGNMNQYNSFTQSGNTISLSYDSNGNLIFDGFYNYNYDSLNRLNSIGDGTETVYYKYDALGRKSVKISSTDTTHHYYLLANEIEIFDHSGNVKRSHVYGTGLDNLISTKIENDYFFFHNSRLGTIIKAFDISGNMVERYEYDPFGEVEIFDSNNSLLTQSAIGNVHFYNGSMLDEFGFYNNRNRHYSATHGRFLQRDPLLYIDGLNLYAFAGNNVPNKRDPFGTTASGEQCMEPGQEPEQSMMDDFAPSENQNGKGSSDEEKIKEAFEKIADNMANGNRRMPCSGMTGGACGAINNIVASVPDLLVYGGDNPYLGCVGQSRELANRLNEVKGELENDWTITQQNGDASRAWAFQHNNVCAKPSNPDLPTLFLDTWNGSVTVSPTGECNGPPGSALDDGLVKLGELFGIF